MKTMKKSLLAFMVLMGCAGLSEAGPALKPGSWTFYFFQGPTQTTVSSKTFCVTSSGTWSTGPTIPPGNGGWTQDGNAVNFYGTIGEAIQGAAFSAFGQMTGPALMTGEYRYFNIVQSAPNGSYGRFKANFTGSVCGG